MGFCYGHTRYFQFTDLPFGLSSNLRAQGFPIAIFVDDGVGAGPSLEAENFKYSSLVCSEFSRCVFGIYHEKSNWEHTNKFSWIGYNIDPHSGFVFATDSRIVKLCSDLNDICAKSELSAFAHVKIIACFVGQIISMTRGCGNVTQIMTRYLHLIINSRRSWNSAVLVHDQGKEELCFWRDNFDYFGVLSWALLLFRPNVCFLMLLLQVVRLYSRFVQA